MNPLFTRSALTLMAVSVAAACSQPYLVGPQIQRQLRGFLYDANSTQGRNVFPEREMVGQGAWWSSLDDDDEYSSLFITRYPGGATRAEVQAARDFQETEYGGARDGYGGLETIQIDGRSAWGWLETSQYRGEISSYEYKAVVSYDSITFAVEFYTREPEWMVPDSLRAVASTFGIGKVEWNFPGLGLAVLVVVLLSALAFDRFTRVRVTSGRVGQMRLAVLPNGEEASEHVPAVATEGVEAATQSPEPSDSYDAPSPDD